MKRLFLALTGWLLCLTLLAQSPQYRFQYWFDGDYVSHVNDSSANGIWQTQLEVSHLSVGFHTLYLHIQDTSGLWSSPRSYLFHNSGNTAAGSSLEYSCWFDQDFAQKSTGILGGDLLLDVTSLQTGFHTLNVMKGERQNAALQSFLFYRSDTRDSENVNVSHTYWFNQDYAHRVEGVGGGDLIIDVTQLKDGFHTLNVMAGKGRSASLQSFLFYKIPSYTSENFNLNYFCWFDENIDSTQHGVISQGPLLLDVSALKDGFHTVNIQLGTGSTNMLKSALFYKMPLVDSTDMALTYICWFDEDYSNSTTGDIGNGNLLFDISSLDEGFHTVNLQFGKGRAAMLQSYLFYKVIEVDSANMAMTYVCWFDEDYASRTSGNLGNGALLFDVSSLQDGFHNINMQFVSGHTTTVRNWIFYKAPDYGVINDSTELTWYYRIDGQECPPIVVTSTNRLIHLDLNVDNIMPGLHSISYYMTAPNGKVSELNTAYFYRTGTGIVRYEYWINGQDSAKTIVNTQPTDTLRLITMLQLDPQPIRTTCFQFDPNEGTPVIYAKNDITFRFWTGDSRFTDRKSYYIDEYVKDTVVADTLTPHVISQRTFTEPVANQIRWYKINAQIGDSLAVKASRASMLQLFSPSGEEVYTATDLKSIEYGGCNVFEDGYYYLAVHDVAPSNDSLTIYYQHIGKFAVLAHTPDHIGNLAGSYFDMELFGNGMLQLDSVWLTQGGTFLAADTIIASNKSKATAVFHIQDTIPNGMYAAHFMFRDSISNETIVISNAIQFEEVDWGEILVSYSMPSRMAKPYPVVVTLENTGNMDLTYVPFNMAVDNINSINRITLENSIITMSPSADSSDYSTMVATQNLLGRQIDGGMIFSLIPIIRAKEKMRFVLSFDAPAHTMFNFWAWTDSSYEQTSHFLSDTLLYKAYFFNYKERSGIKATTAEQDAQNSQRYRNTLRATGLASGAASVLPRPARDAGRGLAVGRTFFQVGGAIGGVVQGLQNAQLDAHEENLRWALGDEEFEAAHHRLMSPEEIAPGIGGAMTRINGLMQQQQHCSQQPNPDPGPGCHVHVVVPGDPNDIIGYTAESGSRYIRRGITNVNYEIEFENDTSLASAAAHTIIVRDTLDADKFSFSSFNWKGIRIGSHSVIIDGGFQTIKTIDLRPDLNVVAQVALDFNASSGIAVATITSLDPMTLLPTTDPDQGALPVNYIGNGVGSVTYNIDLLDSFADGTAVSNRASIVFDNEDAIMTPTWTNIFDLEDPVSYISHAVTIEDSTALYFQGTDNRSGIWHYTLYGRQDSTQAWSIVANNIEDSLYQVSVDDSIVYYMVMATDSAGNVEIKNTELDFTTTEGTATYFTVTATADTLRGAATGGGSIRQYRTTTLTATPHYGYHFIGWDDGDTANPRVVTVTSDTTLTALFDVNQYEITVLVEDLTAGYAYGGGLFDYMSVDSLYAIAYPHYHFAGWSDGDSSNPRALTVTRDSTVTALFAIDTHHVTLLTDSTMATVNGMGDYAYGAEVTVATEPISPCYHFVAWQEGNWVVSTEASYTFILDRNVSLTAIYDVNVYFGEDSLTACESYTWYGTTYTESGSYLLNTVNANGCDSTAVLHLTINNPVHTAVTETACDSFTWNDSVYTASGDYTYSHEDANGCTQVDTLHLTINYSTTGDTSVVACDSFDWCEYTNLTQSGDYTHTFTNAAGCDSVVTLHLTVNYSNTGDTNAVFCDSFDWYEYTNLTQSGEYTHTFTNATGCDSVVTLHLTVNYSNTGDTTVVVCNSFDWYEHTNLTQSGDYTHTFTNVSGCDSVVTLHLTINYSNTGDTIAVTCNSFDWYEYTNLTQSGEYTHTFTNVAGCDSVVTLHLTVNYSNTGDTTAIVCDSFDWYEHDNLTQSGEYTHTFTNAAGCDSVVTLHLTVNYSNTGDTTAIACDSFDWYEHTSLMQSGEYAHTFTNAAGCDSVVTLHLTVNYPNTADTTAVACDSFDWYEHTNLTRSGEYTHTFTNAAGCDSVVTLHLTVNYSNTGDTTAVACDSFDWYEHTSLMQSGEYAHAFTNAAGCDSVVTLHLTVNYSNTADTTAVACDSFDWYEHTNLTQSGEYTHTFTNAAGCDSVVTLHLTVNYSNTGDTTAVFCSSFDWYEHTSLTQSGEYTHTFTNAAGCDSVVTLHLTVNYSNTGDTTAIACDSFDWYECSNLTQSGDYTHTFTNAAGCDSVVTLHLTINQSITGTDVQTACGSFTWIDGITYTESNSTATYTLTNAAGCDSVVTLNLTVNQPSTSVDVQTVCGNYTWIDGVTYTESDSTATYTLANAAGCDSVVTLNLTINQPTTGTDVQTACGNFTWIDGVTYTESNSTATYTLTNAAGCDSVVTLNLTLNQPTTGTDVQTACGNFTWIDGVTYTESNNTATYTLANAAGCDSVVTLNLTINQPTTGIDVQTACGSYTWMDGITYTESNSTATYTLANAAGCDSVVTLNLTINQPTTGTDVQTACDSYTWIDGVTYTESNSTATYTLTNAAGCDSIVTLNLTINYSTHNVETETVCESFTWHGATYTTSGTFTYEYTNASGCASVDTLYLTVNYGTHNVETETACESFTWHGTEYTATGTYTYEYTNASGCASADTLKLTINQPVAELVEATACDSYEWNGTTYTETGDYTQTFIAANGCDSVVTLHLTLNPSVTEEIEVTTTDSCYTWNSQSYCTSGDYTQTLQTIHGCDSIVTLHLTITVGIDDHNLGASMTVYPNPTNDIINVRCTMYNVQVGTLEFHVFDAYGKLIGVVETRCTTSLQTDTNGNPTQTAQIDLSRHVSGVYFVKAVADDRVVAVRKVIKN